MLKSKPTLQSDIPVSGVKKHIIDLAKQHNINYVKTFSDEWANTITRLADDEVEPDNIELLLIALKRANIVNTKDMTSLLINYLREKLNVRSI